MFAKKRPKIPVVRHVKWTVVTAWTALQLACALGIFAVGQFASVGYLYPALLTLLVPFRSYILGRFFAAADLQHLDPANETEEEFHDEQRLVHHTVQHGEVDEEDLAFPTRAEFRGEGIKREIMDVHHHGQTTTGHEIGDLLALDVAKAYIGLDVDDATKVDILLAKEHQNPKA